MLLFIQLTCRSTKRHYEVNSQSWQNSQQNVDDSSPTQDNITVVTIEDTSTEVSQGQSTKQIEIINLESTDEQIRAETNISTEQAHEVETASTPADAQNTEEKHNPATTLPAKSSVSDLNASDFFNPSEFWVSTQNFDSRGCVMEEPRFPGDLRINHENISQFLHSCHCYVQYDC